jgi:hypothetical protein
VSENRALRRAFGTRRVEVAGDWRKPNIVSLLKSRRMKWTGHVASMEDMNNAYNVLKGRKLSVISIHR